MPDVEPIVGRPRGRFTGRAVVVTGAASGMGRSIARRLQAEGSLVLAVDRDAGGLRDLAQEQIGTYEIDLGKVEEIPNVIAHAMTAFGRLDGLVNCAGVMQTKPMMVLTPEDWDRVMAINLRAAFFCLQAAAKPMMEAGRGAIVNFSSVSGRSGRPFATHYAASKAGVISMTRSAALALAPHVRVNAICPGLVDTPMWKQIDLERSTIFGVPVGESFKRIAESVPLGRAASPDEIAVVVSFLLSDDAGYITGQSFNVDGGMERD